MAIELYRKSSIIFGPQRGGVYQSGHLPERGAYLIFADVKAIQAKTKSKRWILINIFESVSKTFLTMKNED